MRFSDGEKLIVMMLADISKKMDTKGEIDPDFVASTVTHDYLWALHWKYAGIPFEDQESPQEVKETATILEMWSFIERSYDEFTDDERKYVKENASPLGNSVRFDGFDGNDGRGHYGIALFLINELDRFTEFKGRDLNSHAPSLEPNMRMLPVFNRITTASHYELLTPQELVEILKSQAYR